MKWLSQNTRFFIGAILNTTAFYGLRSLGVNLYIAALAGGVAMGTTLYIFAIKQDQPKNDKSP